MPSRTSTMHFAHYNTKYYNLKRTDFDESREDRLEATAIVRWDIDVQPWPQEFIQYSVYGIFTGRMPPNTTVEEWQQFRVSMKGQSTRMKLYRLKCLHEQKCSSKSIDDWAMWQCRIDNYIGALVRGGQLEHKTYKVLS